MRRLRWASRPRVHGRGLHGEEHEALREFDLAEVRAEGLTQPLTIDQVLTLLAEHPTTIAALTAGLPHPRLHRAKTGGEWSVNDVLAHLRSCSDVWGKYIAMILAEDHPTIRAMNPRAWIKSTDYPELEFGPSFRAYKAQRAKLLALLRPLPKAAWSRSATVTGAGRPRERTVLEYGQRLANHERTHVRHVSRLVIG